MKQKTLILGVVALLAYAGIAHAQDGTTSANGTTTSTGVRVEQKTTNPLNLIRRDFMEKRIENKALFNQKRDDIRGDIQVQQDLMLQKRREMQGLSGEAKTEMRNEMKEDRSTFRENIKGEKHDLRDFRHEIIKARFTGMAERFSMLISRIDMRIQKLTSEGEDTTVATAALAKAKITFTEIKAAAAALATSSTTVSADGTRNFNKEAVEALKTKMKKLQEELKQVIMSLKDIKVEVKTETGASTKTSAGVR